MIIIKKYFKSILYIIISILIFNILLTIGNYYDIIGNNINIYLKLTTIIISLFIGGFYIGKNSSNKGYIEGIKIGLIIILIEFLLNLSLIHKIKFNIIIYYIITLSSTTLGSILGINKKSKT